MTTPTPQPRLSLTPRCAAVADHEGATLDVLVRIIAPAPSEVVQDKRPPLHLALVIDRSGSMAGQPLAEAWRAACHVVSGLGPRDKAALVSFHDHAQTHVPLVGALERSRLLHVLSQPTETGGCTNLHGGWTAGVEALAAEAAPDVISRVILLSDGAANRGVTDLDILQAQCAELARAHVGTSTYGLGQHFNEELMIAMARAGQGNSYYGQTAQDLLDPFQEELSLLNALCARHLLLRATAGPAVEVELLNAFPGNHSQGWRLPDLALGGEAWALLRLTMPATLPGTTELRLDVTLEYQDLEGINQHCDPAALPLPRIPAALLATMPEDETVASRVRELDIATLQEQAQAAARARDWDTVAALLDRLRAQASDRPHLQAIVAELQALHDRRDEEMFAKEARYASRRLRERLIAREDLQVAEAASHFRLKTAQGRAAPSAPPRQPARVTVVSGDITTQPDCAVIVNSAHRSLAPGGGVSGAIHRAAGPGLALHCQGLGPLPSGQCIMTPAFNLPNRFVIHTVVPNLTLAGSAAFNRLGRCLEAVLETADRHGLERIAVPALGLGERGYPADRAIPTLVDKALQVAARAQHLQEIRFVVADAVTLAGFQAVLGLR